MRGRKTEILQIHYVFRVFRFLSPTKLNRNELAGYSKAHSIQPLCLAGVVRLWTYSCFEALKVRDSKRLEPVQRYRYYKIIRKHSKKSTPEGCAFKKRKLCMEHLSNSYYQTNWDSPIRTLYVERFRLFLFQAKSACFSRRSFV